MNDLSNLDPEVLKVAQAAADVKRERDSLRLELQQALTTLDLANTRLEERQAQIDRLQQQLLLAVARNGQQVGIIEQIGKLTEAFHESVHAEDGQGLARNN